MTRGGKKEAIELWKSWQVERVANLTLTLILLSFVAWVKTNPMSPCKTWTSRWWASPVSTATNSWRSVPFLELHHSASTFPAESSLWPLLKTVNKKTPTFPLRSGHLICLSVSHNHAAFHHSASIMSPAYEWSAVCVCSGRWRQVGGNKSLRSCSHQSGNFVFPTGYHIWAKLPVVNDCGATEATLFFSRW